MQTTEAQPRKNGRPPLPRGPDGQVIRPTSTDGENPAVQRKINRSLTKVIDATIKAAAAGEVAAQRLLLERGIAAKRPVEPKVAIPGLSEAPTAQDAAMVVRQAAARGLITFDDAKRTLEYLKAELQFMELYGVIKMLKDLYTAKGEKIPKDVRAMIVQAEGE
ncbi:hypothetical protein [Paraburkholderia domus]|uniref:hypothetical protein n=1 Tax=Paraburkholderia domus TaxID=2793075 RepID=UPI001B032DE5|nr:hypothetical protein [Paraburkholderia domus]CAE6835175.1 hypothetical protein R75483_06884 [Paraburkholderia domus]